MLLYNRVGREELIKQLHEESFKRITISFYRYVYLDEPQEYRDMLYKEWVELGAFGRIYIAHEGVNAQMSIPEHKIDEFLAKLNLHSELVDMPIKYAVRDDGKSFFKLTIKVRSKIVADGLEDHTYDVTNVGSHLSPVEFHHALDNDDVIVVDMRNHYESEVGHFENAFCPDSDTFKDAITAVESEYIENKDKKVLLYCTGGIRCEKASAYLKYKGFTDVNQLHGGIIAYAHEIDDKGITSKFTGKNFVFDQRLGESIDGKVISHCHQCGELCDVHTNCANDDCHLLFIQCPNCAIKYNNCCSNDCKEILSLPVEKQKEYRKLRHQKYASSKIFKSRIRPKLMETIRENEKIDGEFLAE